MGWRLQRVERAQELPSATAIDYGKSNEGTDSMLYLKAAAIWILIAFIETIHGILRARLLTPRVGDLRSRQIAVLTGSVLILVTTYLTFDWLNPPSTQDAIVVGLIWFIAMFIFEMALGHYVFRFPWKWLLNDFNPLKGKLLLFGMIILLLAPYIVGNLKGRFQ